MHGPNYRWRYAILTVAVFVPLVASAITQRQFYPIPAWSLFSESARFDQEWHYYFLRGETVGGDLVDLPPIRLTPALFGRCMTMTNYVLNNESLRVTSPHPTNVALLTKHGGSEEVPRAVHLPALLKAWGRIYNSRHKQDSPQRLKAMQLDHFTWAGESYDNTEQQQEPWRIEL